MCQKLHRRHPTGQLTYPKSLDRLFWEENVEVYVYPYAAAQVENLSEAQAVQVLVLVFY